MRLSQTKPSNSVSQKQSEERVSSQPTDSKEATKSAATTDVINNSSLRSVYLRRALHKISSRSPTASSIKALSTQAQSINGAQLKVGAQARPYLKLFLAGVELDKNRK